MTKKDDIIGCHEEGKYPDEIAEEVNTSYSYVKEVIKELEEETEKVETEEDTGKGVVTCGICGTEIEYEEGKKRYSCPLCGAKIII